MVTGMQRWRGIGSCLILGVVIVAAQLRILTTITGQDPFTYVRVALELIDGAFRLEAWRSVAGFVVPGYPALLAVVVLLAGPLAVAWVNMVFFLAACILLYGLLRRGGMRESGALIALLGMLLLLFTGYPLYPHFLFYAFRSAPQFFFIVCAYYVESLARPSQPRHALLLSLVTLLLCLGATIRETTLLAFPGVAIALWWDPLWHGRRWRALFWLALPLIVVATLLGAFWVLGLVSVNNQVQTWVSYLTGQGAAAYAGRLMAYGQIFARGSGWPMLLLLALGVWSLRRCSRRLVLWVLPALLFTAFYSVFLVHYRYWFDSYLMLAVVCGVGAWFLCERLARRLAPSFRPVFTGGVILGLTAWNLVAISGLGMWGPRVSRQDIRRITDVIDAAAPAQILTDWDCMFMIEALWVHARVQPLAGWDRLPQALAEGRMLYMHPERIPSRQRHGYSASEEIRRQADLLPVRDARGDPVTVQLGDFVYSVQDVVPWEARALRTTIEIARHQRVFWLDFRESDPEAERRVELLDDHGTVLQSWQVGEGNGLIPFVLDSAIRDARSYTLTVLSGAVMPAELRVEPIWGGHGLYYFGQGRRLSIMDWVDEPIIRSSGPWAAVLVNEGVLQIPVPRNMPDEPLLVSVGIAPRFPDVASVTFTYTAADNAPIRFTNSLRQARMRHDLLVTPPAVGPGMTVHVATDPVLADNHFRITDIQVRLPSELCAVAIGGPYEWRIPQSGCYGVEWSVSSASTFRWTKGRAELGVPVVRPDSDVRFQIRYSEVNVPATLRPLPLAVTWNGHLVTGGMVQVDRDGDDTIITGTVKAAHVLPENAVVLETEPWSPSDFGSGDSRELGVMLHSIEWDSLD